MNKEEILAKSRAENNDEGLKNMENRGRRIGFIAFSCMYIFILIFNLFNGKDNYVPMAMYMTFIAAEFYSKYKFTQNKSFMFATICGIVASALNLLGYVESVLR